MTDRRLLGLLLAAALCTTSFQSFAQNPVQNVQGSFQGTIATISYDLMGEGLFNVSVAAALTNGTALPMTAILGDAGPGIRPGPNRQIFWDILVDLPTGVDGEIVFSVTAQQVQEKKGRGLLYVLIGALVAGAGGTAAILLKADDPPGNGGTTPVTPADPPSRPLGN